MLADEAREAADGARRQLARTAPLFADLARRLAATPPQIVMTCARGSSDHAATYGKYLIETTVGRVVASVGPSVASVYDRTLHGIDRALFVAVSQSGESPDLLELTRAAKDGGALVVGMINAEQSPLAALCDLVIPLCAGPELAVAATKSFLLAGLAFVQLVAAWTGDPALHAAAAAAPDAFTGAPWDLTALARAQHAYVIGRGIGLGAAAELALKLKETCRLHAEAFSTAEILHGPVALVEPGFPIVALTQPDATESRTRAVIDQLVALGADVHLAPPTTCPPILAPLCHVQRFYLGIPALAAARGLDADRPAHLAKVTRTR